VPHVIESGPLIYDICNDAMEIRRRIHTRYTATHCNTLQHTATHCNTLQRIYNGDSATYPHKTYTRTNDIDILHTHQKGALCIYIYILHTYTEDLGFRV